MKTYCFKLYQSERNSKLHRQINIAALIYNHCIAIHKRFYALFGKHLNRNKLQKHLVRLKRLPRFSFLKELGSQAVQDVTDRIERAYTLFFRNVARKIRCSPPNFKKVRRYKSFTLKQSGWKLDEDSYTLTLNGQHYRYFQSRRISGKIKTVTIKRDSLSDIYIYVVTDAVDSPVMTRTGKSVGYDFGLKRFLTASDGRDIIRPLFFAQNIRRIKQACRNLSRKRKGSNNQQRARLNLARLYKQSANQRHDFHFKLARQLCREYETVCIEDLNVKAMQRLYGRKIGDLGFSEFIGILKYEAMKFGTTIIKVDRYFASSQLCSECGFKNPAVKELKVREWDCPQCGVHQERDRNAAINILVEGSGHRPMQETL